MSAITVRNLSDDTHRALRLRAAEHGRSTEAEIRAILDDIARPKDRVKMGDALIDLFRPLGGVELDTTRDRTPVEPLSFE